MVRQGEGRFDQGRATLWWHNSCSTSQKGAPIEWHNWGGHLDVVGWCWMVQSRRIILLQGWTTGKKNWWKTKYTQHIGMPHNQSSHTTRKGFSGTDCVRPVHKKSHLKAAFHLFTFNTFFFAFKNFWFSGLNRFRIHLQGFRRMPNCK